MPGRKPTRTASAVSASTTLATRRRRRGTGSSIGSPPIERSVAAKWARADPYLHRLRPSMRLVLATLCLVACSEPAYHAKLLPPLVVPKTSSELTQITPPALGFAPGESFSYTVRVRGFAIGTATLTASQT